MKQVKQIIEFILILASCFFRAKKQQKSNPYLPEDPYPPGAGNGRKGDCPCGPGCSCNPEPPQPPEQSGERYLPAVVPKPGNPSPTNPPEDSTPPTNGAATLLGWCLIAVAGTSYLYKLLA